jgi:hypothetical protein
MDAFGQFQAVHPRHVDVGEAAVDVTLFQNVQSLGPVSSRDDVIAPPPEILSDHPQDTLLVIDDQNRFALFRIHDVSATGPPDASLLAIRYDPALSLWTAAGEKTPDGADSFGGLGFNRMDSPEEAG